MSTNIGQSNSFFLWMTKLSARSAVLLTKAEDGAPLSEISVEFKRLESIWENYVNYANQFEINLLDYKGLVNQIIGNFHKIQAIIEKREKKPLYERIYEPSMKIATTVDDFLKRWGFIKYPLFVPIANFFLGLIKVSRLLSPPLPKPLLPPPSTTGEVCRYCHGTKTEKCPVCDGTGYVVNLGLFKSTCPTCHGTGKVDCLYCKFDRR